jgi:hypothetical protein
MKRGGRSAMSRPMLERAQHAREGAGRAARRCSTAIRSWRWTHGAHGLRIHGIVRLSVVFSP